MLRSIEGASQRVQEDTLKFARIMEGLGTELLDSINDIDCIYSNIVGFF